MLTDAQIDSHIRSLEDEIRGDEMKLDRKRIKLEVLRELRVETAGASGETGTNDHKLQPTNGHHDSARPYRGMQPTPAILRYLNDHSGTATMTSLLDTLSDQIKSESDTPRNIVRNCARQLAKRGMILIDSGNVTLSRQSAETN